MVRAKYESFVGCRKLQWAWPELVKATNSAPTTLTPYSGKREGTHWHGTAPGMLKETTRELTARLAHGNVKDF